MGNKLIAGGNNGTFFEINNIQSLEAKPVIIPRRLSIANFQRVSALISPNPDHLIISGDLNVLKLNASFDIVGVSEIKNRHVAAVKEFVLKKKQSYIDSHCQ